MKNPPVVRVEWVDTRMYPGWQDGQQTYEPVTVVNVGFLLNDDDHSKQTYNVAAQWSPEFGAGADVTVIPMGCVTDIDDLRDPANDPFFAVEDEDFGPSPLDCGNPNCEYPGDLCDPPPQAQDLANPTKARHDAPFTSGACTACNEARAKMREKLDANIIQFPTPEFDLEPEDIRGVAQDEKHFRALFDTPVGTDLRICLCEGDAWCEACLESTREDRFVENFLSSEYFCPSSWCCGTEDEREKHARDRFLQYRDDPEGYKYLAKYDTFGKES